jgi:cobalt/nickel transport system permease protein
MTLALHPLPNPASPLSRRDPRWKLATLVLLALAVAAFHTLTAAALALAGALLLASFARPPARWFLARLATVGGFLITLVILFPFLLHGEGPSWQFGPLAVSAYGARLALLICLKALAIVTVMLVLLVTAPLDATLKAAQALRMPGVVIYVVLLTYRYLFVLADEWARLRIALRVRGYRNRADRHSYRTVGHVAGTLLVRGSERAERVGQAMRCRGFDGQFRSLTNFQTTAADVVLAVLLLGSMAALLSWDVCQP